MNITYSTRVTLTVGQIKRLIAESREDISQPPDDILSILIVPDSAYDQENESFKGAISLSLLAWLLSVGNIVTAGEVKTALSGASSPEQVQKVIDSVGKTTYGGYSAAQAANILMRTIYQEARGESPLGRRMVATVIWNRAGGNPDKLPGVCLRKYQFSVWNGLSDRSPEKFKTKVPSGVTTPGKRQTIWNEVKGLVEDMLNGTFVPEGNYNAYLNPETASQNALDTWGSDMTGQRTVGHHKFGYLNEYDGFKKVSAPTVSTYTVKKGDKGISYIARDLIKSKKTTYTSTVALTNKILELNKLKRDKRGNPIIRPGQVLRIPS